MAILSNTWKFHDVLTAPDGNTQVDQTIDFVDADGKAYINMGANITGGHVFFGVLRYGNGSLYGVLCQDWRLANGCLSNHHFRE